MSVNKFPIARISDMLSRVNNLSIGAPESLGFTIESFGSTQLQLGLARDGYLNRFYNIWINGVNFEIPDTDPLVPAAFALDLSTTGLNGIVDGIAFEMGRQYLLWAVSNPANTEFAGIVATRKPYMLIGSITGDDSGPGILVKGEEGVVHSTAASDPYQFTIGARVLLRTDNNPNAYGQGEWNWATITNNTGIGLGNIRVIMDDNSDYGFDITGLNTLSELIQMDSFQPYVVTPTNQTLYAVNIRLLGEVYTDPGDGHIYAAFKADDEFRIFDYVNNINLIWNVTATVNSIVSTGNLIPLWATQAILFINHSGTAGDATNVQSNDSSNVNYASVYVTSVGVGNDGTGYINLNQYASLVISSSITAGTSQVLLNGYRVPGGMRL